MAAYLLAILGGKSNPSKADVREILESIGLDIDDEKLTKVSAERLFFFRPHAEGDQCYYLVLACLQVVSELEGKDINEVISEGMGKLASMPSGRDYSYLYHHL